MEEIWKYVDGCNEAYQVSNFGNIRKTATGKCPYSFIGDNGKIRVDLNQYGIKSLHILVARAFIPNPKGYQYVDHIDKNFDNNNACNLRWVKSIRGRQGDKSDLYKSIFCVETEETFKTLSECCLKYDLNPYYLTRKIDTGKPYRGKHFKWIF